MKFLVPLFCLAVFAASPALAQSDGGQGHGWRGGGGRFEQGGHGDGRVEQGGRGDGRFQRGDGPGGRGGRFERDGEQPNGGRGNRSFPGANGVLYAQPPDRGGEGHGNPQQGRWNGQQNEAREGVREGRYQSMGEILSRIRQRQPGQQLDAGLSQGPSGRAVYRVRWAARNGRLIDYTVDAQTGAIISEEGR